MVKELLLDSDDVLVDWKGYVGKRLHLVSPIFNILQSKENIAVLNELPTDERKAIMAKYYAKFPRTFRNLEIASDFYTLVLPLQHLINIGWKVTILTAIGEDHPDPEAVCRDKEVCLKEHFREVGFLPDIICVPKSSDKAAYAMPTRILVDDYLRNIKEFDEMGGVAIHHTSALSTHDQLLKYI